MTPVENFATNQPFGLHVLFVAPGKQNFVDPVTKSTVLQVFADGVSILSGVVVEASTSSGVCRDAAGADLPGTVCLLIDPATCAKSRHSFIVGFLFCF